MNAGAAGAIPRLTLSALAWRGQRPGCSPGPGEAIAPAPNSGPGPGGTISPGNFFGLAPGFTGPCITNI